MNIVKATKEQIFHLYRQYIEELVVGIDRYQEQWILRSDSYLIQDQGIKCIYSIDSEGWLTGLYVLPDFSSEYNNIFQYVISLPEVKNIVYSTMDTNFELAISKENLNEIKQTYDFILSKKIKTDFMMSQATEKDYYEIQLHFGDFLEYNNTNIYTQLLYIHRNSSNEIVCLGYYEMFTLVNKAGLAMIVKESERRKGYGTKTLRFLSSLLQQKGINIHARCWYENGNSKSTIIKAGFELTNLVKRIKDIKR